MHSIHNTEMTLENHIILVYNTADLELMHSIDWELMHSIQNTEMTLENHIILVYNTADLELMH